MRQDLLLLTSDDLATLSNRGIVKRAQQEMQSLKLQAEFQEDTAGNVEVQWSDEVLCKLPADVTISQGQCSCPATSICRHIVRSVLAYQAQDLDEQPAAILLRRHSVNEWNPADISDEILATLYSKAQLNKLRSQYSAGLVIGVNCGTKPTAHFHTLSLNLRFLVPNDLRYTHCDCSEAAPCSHVPLAVWAFRELGDSSVERLGQRTHGLISTAVEVVPTVLLDDIETHLLELAECGIANMERTLPDRLNRLEQRCRDGNLVWLAEILVDLMQAYHLYQQRDGSFVPDRVVDLLAELWMRSDAIRHRESSKHQIPQLLIGGSQLDKTSSLGASRLVGLGCGVTLQSKGVTLTAYLQDSDSGTLMAMPKYFGNVATDDQPASFQQLAQATVSKGLSLASIGARQLLTKGGKRTPSYEFVPGRSALSLHLQSFRWEQLRSPLLADSFADLQAALIDLPPRLLRPRRVTESLQVLPIAQVEQVFFDPITQNIRATLLDASGDRAFLIHPYTSRGAAGAEALLEQLKSQELRFVAAQVSLGAGGLVLAPLSLVFESDGQRSLLQPWIDAGGNEIAASLDVSVIAPQSPVADYLEQLSIALADLWLVGLNKADDRHCRQWQELLEQGRSIGFQKLLPPLELLSAALGQKHHALTWNLKPARQALSTLTVLYELSHQALAEETK
jgi:hypothetical protein